MAQQLINIGTTANDGTGDPLRTAFDKINDNFTEVYSNITAAVEVSADTSPTLGGNLNVGTHGIVSTNNGNIRIDPNGTGFVILDSLRVNVRTLSSNVTNQPTIIRGNGTAGVDIANVEIHGGHMDNVIVGGNIAAAGSFTDLNVSGNASVAGNLAVTSNTALTGNLAVTGTSAFTGNLTINGARNYLANELRVGTNVNSPYRVSFSTATNNQSGTLVDGSVRLHLQSADNNFTRLLMESQGTATGSIITAKHTNGTAASPAAVENTDVLLRIQARGYDGIDWSPAQAEIRFVAVENWNDTDHGTSIQFYTTPVNSNVMTRSATLSSQGNLQIDGQLTVSGIGLSRIGGSCQIDEMLIGTGEISSLVTNGDITITANGSGRLIVASEMTVAEPAIIDGISIGTSTIENTVTNGGINLIPNGTGKVSVLGQLRYVNANFPTSSVGQLGDQEGDVAVTSGYFYYCTANYDGSTDIWKRVAWDVGTW